MIDTDRLIKNINVKNCIETYTGRRMRNNKTLCPFHNDHVASLSVKTEKGLWMCWTCGKGGNIINFTREFFGLGFIDACRKLSEDFGIDDIGITSSSKLDAQTRIEMEVKQQSLEDRRKAKQKLLQEILKLTAVHRILFRLEYYDAAAGYAEEIDMLEAQRECL